MSDIKTTPEMNINRKQILKISGNPAHWYAAQRIEELEAEGDKAKTEAAVMRKALEAYYYWWPFKRPHGYGQAKKTLSCGHAGPIGAPCCRECAKQKFEQALSSTAGQDLLTRMKALTGLYHAVESWFKAGQPKALSEEWDDLNNAFNIAHFALSGGDTNAS